MSRTPKNIRHSVQPQGLDRRTVLRGALGGLGVCVGLPALEIMLNNNGTALAQGQPLPKRFGVYFWGCGIVHSEWVPTTTGLGWTLPPSLSAFKDLKDYVSLITGTNHSKPGTLPHIPGRGLSLSASRDLSGNRGQNHPEPSVDSLVQEYWGGEVLGVSISQRGPYRNNSSWKRGGKVYNRQEPVPQRFFDRVFTDVKSSPGGDTGLLDTTQKLKLSLLDACAEDTTALKQKLGGADRQRLDQHLSGIRSLEQKLSKVDPPPVVQGCNAPARPAATSFGDGGSREQKLAKGAIMNDLLAMTMACDLGRIFSYEWSATQSEAIYWEVDHDFDHHALSHGAGTNNRSLTAMKRLIKELVMTNLADLAQKLKDLPEGGGNVLDNTLFLGTSEHANGTVHDYIDHPYLLVGKAGGGLRSGLHYRHPNLKNNFDAPKALLTAVRAVGVPAPGLGQVEKDRWVSAPISELLT